MHSILSLVTKCFIFLNLLSGLFSCSNNLSKTLAPNNRTEYIQGDSVYIFSFLVEGKKVKTDKDRRYFYYVNQALASSEGAYRGKVLHGPRILSLRNNALIEKGSFELGLKSGEWLTWHENGTLQSTTFYKKGKKRGAYKAYTDKGTLLLDGHFHNGLKSGKWVTYDTTGIKLLEENWNDGKRNGMFQEYYKNGGIKRKGKYKNGQLHGKISGYDFEGSKEVVRFKKGDLKQQGKKKEGTNKDLRDNSKGKKQKICPFGKKEDEGIEIRSETLKEKNIKRKERKTVEKKKEGKVDKKTNFNSWFFKKKKKPSKNRETP